ncbi:MAG: hypothetical protein AAGA64_07035 [Bacteroidota bacterium]
MDKRAVYHLLMTLVVVMLGIHTVYSQEIYTKAIKGGSTEVVGHTKKTNSLGMILFGPEGSEGVISYEAKELFNVYKPHLPEIIVTYRVDERVSEFLVGVVFDGIARDGSYKLKDMILKYDKVLAQYGISINRSYLKNYRSSFKGNANDVGDHSDKSQSLGLIVFGPIGSKNELQAKADKVFDTYKPYVPELIVVYNEDERVTDILVGVVFDGNTRKGSYKVEDMIEGYREVLAEYGISTE